MKTVPALFVAASLALFVAASLALFLPGWALIAVGVGVVLIAAGQVLTQIDQELPPQ